MQDDQLIQIVPTDNGLIIFRAHMNTLFIIKAKMVVTIKWSYMSPNHVSYWA